MGSTTLSPLEKLYDLQNLSIMDYFEKNKQDFTKNGNHFNVVLTQDENIYILTYIMIQAAIPDLSS
jgi:hypothetical protein|tara:strand:+ start:562 stop:759 length:198 start_codon:yes stop_codon:yes gene_type:complete